ncbi:MAG: RsmB/NOP family class I SAM-dependent RNA methyltransferase [Lentisphaeria bacterium]|nr:RsmB/NOP family class I SAM-dependent RNA methyltransferase [Lentisphaeria bacterium]
MPAAPSGRPDHASSTSHANPSPMLASLRQVLDALKRQEDNPAAAEELELSRLARNLLLTIHRRLAGFDWLLEHRCHAKPRPRLRRLLWWAMAEIFWMDGVPAPAVVDTAVQFCKKNHAVQEARFVNACLRTLTAALAENTWDAMLADAPAHVRLDLPEQLWKRWQKDFSPAALRELAAVLQQPAATVFRRRQWPPNSQPAPAWLTPLPAPDWAPDTALFTAAKLEPGDLEQLMGPDTAFYIQDPSTLLAPALLAVQPGEHVADLCAAPGGKAVLLAEALRGQGALRCFDRAATKLDRLRGNLAAFGNVTVTAADATDDILPAAAMDAILLDVPCTNTGVIRRRPDARWSFSNAKLHELAAIQKAILAAAAPAVRPGGRLVYSTCSLEPEENRLQVEAFLTGHPEFRCAAQRLIIPAAGHDGAYAALLVRTKS